MKRTGNFGEFVYRGDRIIYNLKNDNVGILTILKDSDYYGKVTQANNHFILFR